MGVWVASGKSRPFLRKSSVLLSSPRKARLAFRQPLWSSIGFGCGKGVGVACYPYPGERGLAPEADRLSRHHPAMLRADNSSWKSRRTTASVFSHTPSPEIRAHFYCNRRQKGRDDEVETLTTTKSLHLFLQLKVLYTPSSTGSRTTSSVVCAWARSVPG
jgi:hypothetical protein